ncbi:GntR family transcriptional regulator [Novosphingobium sp. P6W]|uniref:GntR family transcriptional regulator n=1 Tax=Novosphingobium sp. P6W TaxID=1609758 RepID=UPI001F05A98A|nr:GntR family transcriptional regulator [Novosphingobium sp. P6W]
MSEIGATASDKVYLGIMRDLEDRRMVPGQRLIETDLASKYGVGRNAVREAMQRLATRGIADLKPFHSPAIRFLDDAEVLEVLDVAEYMTALTARSAALGFDSQTHERILADAVGQLAECTAGSLPVYFGRARRRFYRALLQIGGNRELQRIFPAVGMHLVFSQFHSPQLQTVRLTDYKRISDAVVCRDGDAAEAAGREHTRAVRKIVCQLMEARSEDRLRRTPGPAGEVPDVSPEAR